MARRYVRGHHGKPPPSALPPEKGYYQQSRRPLLCLLLLLPLLLFYEAGALIFNVVPLTARHLLQDVVKPLGWGGSLVPGILVVVVLLLWHLVRRDSSKVRGIHLLGMFCESLAWAPLLWLVHALISNYIPRFVLASTMTVQATRTAVASPLLHNIVLSVGAGIYEELVFRLFLVGFAGYLLHKCGMRRETANVLMVLVSAALFSWSHYFGYERFQLYSFIWRTAAGVYLGFLFVKRGFGITAMAHAAFDILVSVINHVGRGG